MVSKFPDPVLDNSLSLGLSGVVVSDADYDIERSLLGYRMLP